MKHLEVKLTIDRENAILEGSDEYGEVKGQFDPSPLSIEQREMLVRLLDNASINSDGPSFGVIDFFNDAVVETIDFALQKEAEQKQKDLECLADALMLNDEDFWTRCIYGGYGPKYYLGGSEGSIANKYPKNDLSLRIKKRSLSVIDKRQKEDREKAAAQQREATERKERQAKIDAKRRAKREAEVAIREMAVRSVLKDADKRQYERGMLGQDEQRRLLGQKLFSALAHLDRYARIKGSDVCEHADEVEFVATECDVIPPEQFIKLEELEKLLDQDAMSAEVRYHKGECGYCEEYIVRYSARVTAKIGDWELSREYAL